MMLRSMKRVELVIDTLHLTKATDQLRDAGVTGYTAIPNVAGFGDRGDQRADDVSGVSSNAYLLLAVPDEELDRILSTVKPLLQVYGGICLVSDCQWLDH
ncbi:MAG TPA: hypothetical protein PK098_10240 [Phycisphaerales bacterium]|nr:hypothetical protein [Phycisphaerales bacterium]